MNKSAKFREIANGLADLYEQKNTAYGDSFGRSVKKYGKIAALTRISDKFNRLETLMLNDDIDCGDEKIEDTLRDMASYAIMTVLELYNNGDNSKNQVVDKEYETEEKYQWYFKGKPITNEELNHHFSDEWNSLTKTDQDNGVHKTISVTSNNEVKEVK